MANQKDRTRVNWKENAVAGDTLLSDDELETNASDMPYVEHNRGAYETSAARWIWETTEKAKSLYYNPFSEYYANWIDDTDCSNQNNTNIGYCKTNRNICSGPQLYSDIDISRNREKYRTSTNLKLNHLPGCIEDDQYIDDDVYTIY